MAVGHAGTGELGAFLRLVEAGDVLTFSSNGLTGIADQLATRRPATHVALATSDGAGGDAVVAHAMRDASWEKLFVGPFFGCVNSTSLESLLNWGAGTHYGRNYRSAFLLRHKTLQPHGVTSLISKADEYQRLAGSYEFLDPAIAGIRAFTSSSYKEIKTNKVANSIFYGRARALSLWAWAVRKLKQAFANTGQPALSLSCSEFVYRCFKESAAPDIKTGVISIGPLTNKQLLNAMLEKNDVKKGLPVAQALAWNMAFSGTASSYAQAALKPLDESDLVLPGDLYSSPSFDCVATFTWLPSD